MIEINNVVCDGCIHANVCKHKDEFNKQINQISERLSDMSSDDMIINITCTHEIHVPSMPYNPHVVKTVPLTVGGTGNTYISDSTCKCAKKCI